MAKKTNSLASVLAFEKKFVLSDGLMYGTNWDDRDQFSPITLREKSVRGTISNRLKDAVKNDPVKLNAEVEKPNLQTVDAALLKMGQDTLKLKFTLKVLSGAAEPSACNEETHRQQIQAMGQRYVEQYGFKELARRYAINLANARYLWRNRVGAEKIEVQIKDCADDKAWTFDAYQYGLKNFDQDSEQVLELAERIAKTLSGEQEYLLLSIETYALLGNGQEVYPSEELILDKGNSRANGKKSKVLYAVDGVAAMHSQKLGNAIRTIDTWYPDCSDKTGPIAIEPYGAVTNLGKAYRNPKAKQDFYSLFDRYSMGEDFDSAEQAHYVMAILVRGGVFGQSGKD